MKPSGRKSTNIEDQRKSLRNAIVAVVGRSRGRRKLTPADFPEPTAKLPIAERSAASMKKLMNRGK